MAILDISLSLDAGMFLMAMTNLPRLFFSIKSFCSAFSKVRMGMPLTLFPDLDLLSSIKPMIVSICRLSYFIALAAARPIEPAPTIKIPDPLELFLN